MIHFFLGNKGAHLYYGNIFTCNTCNKVYKTKHGIQKHECLMCRDCQKLFSCKQRLVSHKCQLGPKEYLCHLCKRIFKSELTLNKHKCRYCTDCKHQFSSYQKYVLHKCNKTEILQKSTSTCPPGKLQPSTSTCPPGKSQPSTSTCPPGKPQPSTSTCPPGKLQPSTSTCPPGKLQSSTSTCPPGKPQPSTSTCPPGKPQPSTSTCPPGKPQQPVFSTSCVTSQPLPTPANKSGITQKKHQNLKTSTTGTPSPTSPPLPASCITGVTRASNRAFSPVDMNWQISTCNRLQVPLVKVNPSSTMHLKTPLSLLSTSPTSIHGIRADGNCFFRALSYFICGNENHHDKIRSAIIRHMYTIGDKLPTVMMTTLPVYQYILTSGMAQDHEWATQIEIFAAAHMLQTNIYLYTQESGIWKWLEYSGKFIDKRCEPIKNSIYLNHQCGDHFEVVLAVSRRATSSCHSPAKPLPSTSTCPPGKLQPSTSTCPLGKPQPSTSTCPPGKPQPSTSTCPPGKPEPSTSTCPPGKPQPSSSTCPPGKPQLAVYAEANMNGNNLLMKEIDRQIKLSALKKENMNEVNTRTQGHCTNMIVPQVNEKREHIHGECRKINKKETYETNRVTSHNREKDKIRKRQERISLQYREQEKVHKQTKRMCPEYKENETIRKQNKRMCPEYKENEKSHKQRKRMCPEYKENETIRKQNKRMCPEYKENEKSHKQRKRMCPEYKENDKSHKQRKRMCPEYKENETIRKQNKRMCPEYKENDKSHKQRKRMCPEYKENETIRKQNKRMCPEYKENDKCHKQRKRMCPEYKENETIRKQNKRMCPEYKENEKSHKQRKRMCPEYKENETIRKQNKRMCPEYKENDKSHKQRKRMCPEYKENETIRKQNKRMCPEYKENEKSHKQHKRMCREYKETEITSKVLKRKSEEYKQQEVEHKRQKRTDDDYRKQEIINKKVNAEKKMIENFHKQVAQGPVYICTCCDQLWYKNNVSVVSATSVKDENIRLKCVTGVKSLDGKEYICSTCKASIYHGKIPKLAKQNGLVFPKLPPQLKLTGLEERLVAARIPFMQLRELPRGGQISLAGNVVNVPTNVNKTLSLLPRKQSDEECIPIKLKRRLSFKHHYSYETVRPNKVTDAAKWLVQNSIIYQEEGIKVDPTWTLPEQKSDEQNCANKCSDTNVHKSVHPEIASSKEVLDEDDKWDESTVDDIPAAPLDTLLQSIDLVEESRDILAVAPGEGNSPMSVFFDKNAESLSFPSLYCGEKLKSPNDYDIKVHYSDLCKSELRRSDRRVAGHMPDIFFKLKKTQAKHILDKASICLRKTKGYPTDITAGYLKSDANLKKLVHMDVGFRIFKELRGSPPYWERVKKDLFALLRQLGIPTWFSSFSSADTRWVHLMQILGETVDKKKYTDDEVKQFTWHQKTQLVQKDPVTCARQFDYQVRILLQNVLQNSAAPIGEILDFFYKVEFQMRGSPHIHMLIWIKDAPKLGEDKEEDVIKFVDQYVTCEKSNSMNELVDLQTHTHSRTCKKHNKLECRFHFPLPPMEQTTILEPLPVEMTESEKKEHEKNWDTIMQYLRPLKMDVLDADFDTFLQTIQMDKDSCIYAVRSSIRSKKIFLKRSLAEIRVNNYNPALLRCWRANMDQQFVLDAYQCAMYIVSYIAKSQRGMSNLLYHAAKEASEVNSAIPEQVKFIGNKFLNNVEISAQEAVYLLLQIPLYRSSRDVAFINTSPVEKRSAMVKCFSAIQNLPDDSKDVVAEGILDHYANRPAPLESTCLADFVSKYVRRKQTKTKIMGNIDMECSHSDEEDDESEDLSEVFSLDRGYILVRRQKPICIRYVRYHCDKDSENHYREILMLFHPWRNEDQILGECDTYFESFEQLVGEREQIVAKMKQYEHNSDGIDLAVEQLENINEDLLGDQWDNVAPNTQHVERQDSEAPLEVASAFAAFAPPAEHPPEAVDLARGLGLKTEQCKEAHVINMMKDSKYHDLVQCLNREQRNFFYHVMNTVKNPHTKPFHIFLTGGAGVGKTAVTTAVFQMLLRYLNKEPGCNPDELKILVGAPTGKAAFLIGGNTLHHLFNIPASQGLDYKKLSHEKLNSYRCQYRHVKVLIIDEISMVGNKMLNFVNQRLKEIMGSCEDFGGLSVIAVGDLYQLKPVFDGWIFNNLTEGYGPLSRNLWKDLFCVFHLTKIMRQKDDLQYAELLNRLRTGNQTKTDISLLNTRKISNNIFSETYPVNVPHIFKKNDSVNSHNDTIYNLSKNQISVKAWDVAVGDISPEVKQKVLCSVPSDVNKTMGLCKHLKISVGARVELSTNVDVNDGLANGASGIVMGLSRPGGSNKTSIIWIEFESTSIGLRLRQSSCHLYTKEISKDWTPISEIKRQFNVGRYKCAEILRTQFPLRAAAAKTIHRSQGDSMESAVCDFSGRSFCHSHYVALSRVRSMENLFILTLNEDTVNVSQEVRMEMKRLDEQRLLVPLLQYPADFSTVNFSVLYNNVRSLHAHIEDVKCDPNLTHSDIMIFSETKLSATDTDESLLLPGYHMYRFDHQLNTVARSAYGISVYSKMIINEDHVRCVRQVNSLGAMEVVILTVEPPCFGGRTLRVCGAYMSPRITLKAMKLFLFPILTRLAGESVIILGDFNIDLLKPSCVQLTEIMKDYRQCVTDPTTDYQSLLDHVYTNIPDLDLQCGVFDSYFSDHKPVWAILGNVE